MKIKDLVLAGVLSALSIVLYEFVDIPFPPTNTPLFKISIGIIPLFIIAKYTRYEYAIICPVIVDLFGYLLIGASRGYAFHIGYTFNALLGGIFFVISKILETKNNKRILKLLSIILISLITIVITPIYLILFNKYSLYLKYDIAYMSYLVIGFFILMNIGLIIYIIFTKTIEFDMINLSYIMYQYIVSLFLTPLWIVSFFNEAGWMFTGAKNPYVYYLTMRFISVPLITLLYVVITRIIIIPLDKLYLKGEKHVSN